MIFRAVVLGGCATTGNGQPATKQTGMTPRGVPMTARSRRRFPRIGRMTVAVGAAAACIVPALAASPGTDAVADNGTTITVPSSPGQHTAQSWNGTIPAGANANSDCTGQPAQTIDEHAISVVVPKNVY